ncbi:MAG: hypothetical protein ACOYK9_04120 [Chlamydiia bacterium]
MGHKIVKKSGQVFVRDTDATGRVFCPRPIEWVIEAFERECYHSAHENEGVVIVKASVQYFIPFKWFDIYEMELAIHRVGNRSFDLLATITKGEEKAIGVELTFVVEGSALEFLKRYWDKN